jgi:hypothetical protein
MVISQFRWKLFVCLREISYSTLAFRIFSGIICSFSDTFNADLMNASVGFGAFVLGVP